MAYVPGFEHDIFISYAHVDNAPVEDPDGWVTKLHASLLALIPQKIGRAEGFSIWRDRKLSGNDEFEDTLESAFRRSALMLTILTPSYVASPWCPRELDGFTTQPHSRFGPKVGDKNRVFKVMPAPHIPPDEHPSSLQGSLGYQFYAINQMTEREERFRRTTQQDPDQRYWQRLDDLARDIANVLKKMRSIASGEVPEQGVGPLSTSTQVTPVDSRPSVYLAEVTDDLIDQRDEVKRTLEQHDVKVLPEFELLQTAGASIEAAREALRLAQCSVHLLGQFYGRRPAGEERSFIHLQYLEALAESERRLRHVAFAESDGGLRPGAPAESERGLPRLAWLKKDFDISSADERQKAFLTSVEEDPGCDGELLKSGLEELKDIILSKVARQPATLFVEEDPFFYISCTPDDSERARSILACLRSENCQGIVSPTEGADQNALRKHHRANLRRCDVFMILYGRASVLWVQEKAMEGWEVAKRRKKTPMKMYVCDWPPPQKNEVGLALKNLGRWQSREEFTCDEVRKLLHEMNRDTRRPAP